MATQIIVKPAAYADDSLTSQVVTEFQNANPGIDHSATQERDSNGKVTKITLNIADNATAGGLVVAIDKIGANGLVTAVTDFPRTFLDDYEDLANGTVLSGDRLRDGVTVTYEPGYQSSMVSSTTSPIAGVSSIECAGQSYDFVYRADKNGLLYIEDFRISCKIKAKTMHGDPAYNTVFLDGSNRAVVGTSTTLHATNWVANLGVFGSWTDTGIAATSPITMTLEQTGNTARLVAGSYDSTISVLGSQKSLIRLNGNVSFGAINQYFDDLDMTALSGAV